MISTIRKFKITILVMFSTLSSMAQIGDTELPVSPANVPIFHIPQMQIIGKIQWYNFDTSFYEQASTFNEPLILRGSPYSTDFNETGIITSWYNGNLIGNNSRTTYPGLMTNESASFYITQSLGRLTLSGGVSADKYGFSYGLKSTFGIHGSAIFHVNEHLSFTVFGSHYTNSVYYSPASMPYINQSIYGGYMSLWFNEHIGIDLGAQRTINAWDGSHETAPIVRPTIKLNNGAKIGIDVGYLLKDVIFNNSQNNPTMGPPRTTIPIAPHK